MKLECQKNESESGKYEGKNYGVKNYLFIFVAKTI